MLAVVSYHEDMMCGDGAAEGLHSPIDVESDESPIHAL